MAKEVKNRRENLFINENPPEVLTETKLATNGFVKNTNYPQGSSTAGVVKVSANYGSAVGSGGAVEGVLMGSLRTLAQYNSANNALIISKGTLENAIGPLITKAIADMCGALDSDDVGTTYTMQCVEKTADGYTFVGGKTAPITP